LKNHNAEKDCCNRNGKEKRKVEHHSFIFHKNHNAEKDCNTDSEGKTERKNGKEKIMISYSSHHGSIPSFALVFVLVIVLVLVLRHDLADRTGVANRADTGVRVHTIDACTVARARDGGTVVGIEFAVAANIARAAAAGVSVDLIGT